MLKEFEGEYNFDAAISDDVNSHRLEEGRPWRNPHRPESNFKDAKSLATDTTTRTSDDKVTFKAAESSCTNVALDSTQKNKYRVIKYVETVNTSRMPGWRWVNFYYRTLAW